MIFVYDDGGRAAAGYKGKAGDCVCRAVAIATGKPYREVYDLINELDLERPPRGRTRRTGMPARNGCRKCVSRRLMEALGWRWYPTMGIGTGCKVHLREDELPVGSVVVQVSGHVTAVVDGMIHDTYDPSRGGTRCVYGFWTEPA